MAVKIQETDHRDKTKEELLDKEVATHLALDRHMDLMEGLQEIKEAQALEVVANPLDSVEESIRLKDSFHQFLVDLVVKDLLDTTEAQEEVSQETVLDNMEDLAHMDQEAFLDLMVTTLMEDQAHLDQEAFLDLMVTTSMEHLAHMDQEALLDLMVTTLMEHLAHMDQEAFLDLMVTALMVDHHLQELADHSMERVVNILEVQ